MTSAASVARLDELFAAGVGDVASRVVEQYAVSGSVTRTTFTQALARALGSHSSLWSVREEASVQKTELPGWNPPPFGPDIAVYDHPLGAHPGRLGAIAVAEAGWAVGRSSFDHLLRDVFKVTAAQTHQGVIAGYLIAAAPNGRWREGWACEDWFPADVGTVFRVRIPAYLVEHHGLWAVMTKESVSQVQTICADVEFTTIAVAPFRMWERSGGVKRCSVRCVRVTPLPGPELTAPGDIYGLYDAQDYLRAAEADRLARRHTSR